MIIGIDHGFGMIKTANTSMLTGYTKYEHEPHSLDGTLEWQGSYYVCGASRQPLKSDKTIDEGYYILTLAAICKELAHRNAIGYRVNVTLAAGLPLANFGREKEKFLKYLSRTDQSFNVKFEGKRFIFDIRNVHLYPQGYAAYITQIQHFRDEATVIVADCGSWTLDIMRLNNGIPDAESCISMEYGFIRCMSEIREQISRNYGYSITEAQIERVLQNGKITLDQKVQDKIVELGRNYVHKIMSKMIELGLDTRITPTVFMGGGASLIERHQPIQDNIIYCTNIHANAMGYELILKKVQGNDKAAV